MAMAAPGRLHSSLEGTLDETFNTLVMLGRDEGTHASILVTRITDGEVRCHRSELSLELVGNFRINQDSRPREADLSGVEILSGSSLRGSIEICIGTDDKRRLAAHFERDRRERSGAGTADQLRSVGRASETKSIDIRMSGERSSRLFADALHQVQHARGNTSLSCQIGQQ